jgi:hypothetical protein
MRTTIVLVALLVASSVRAQPKSKEESDDLFGFGDPDRDDALDCSDGEADGCAFATDPLEARSAPFALTSLITPSRWRDLAVSDFHHDDIAHFALGAARDGAGVFFGGATGWDTRGFVEGAPTDAMRTGGLETGVPLLFVDKIRVTAGGFSAADRTGTGGNVDVDLIRGGDHHQVETEVWASASTHGDELHAPLAFETISMRAADESNVLGGTPEGPARRSPSYGLPTARQAPLSAAIGVRARF